MSDNASGGVGDQPAKKKSDAFGCLGAFALVALVAVGCSALGSKESPDGDEVGAYVVCQQWVEEQLRSPSTADFPTTNTADITQAGKVWTVRSYVDAQNGFGATVRTPFVCTATHVDGDTYRGSATLLG